MKGMAVGTAAGAVLFYGVRTCYHLCHAMELPLLPWLLWDLAHCDFAPCAVAFAPRLLLSQAALLPTDFRLPEEQELAAGVHVGCALACELPCHSSTETDLWLCEMFAGGMSLGSFLGATAQGQASVASISDGAPCVLGRFCCVRCCDVDGPLMCAAVFEHNAKPRLTEYQQKRLDAKEESKKATVLDRRAAATSKQSRVDEDDEF